MQSVLENDEFLQQTSYLNYHLTYISIYILKKSFHRNDKTYLLKTVEINVR